MLDHKITISCWQGRWRVPGQSIDKIVLLQSFDGDSRKRDVAGLVSIHGGDYIVGYVGWARESDGAGTGIRSQLTFGGGESVGGKMNAALSLRRRDVRKGKVAGQLLLYPASRIPFDTPTKNENNSELYRDRNGISSFARRYLRSAPAKAYPVACEGR